MKYILLITIMLVLSATLGLEAQTSSLLIQSGDQVGGTSSNTATIRSIYGATMNDLGSIAFCGNATETNGTANLVTNTIYTYATNYVSWTNYSYTTNYIPQTNTSITRITNVVIQTNKTISYQYTNVLASNMIITFMGTITNVLYRTNYYNVNGTTNAYVSKSAQLLYIPNSPGTFTNINYMPLGYHAVTNAYITNVPQISFQTNYTITNRPVVTSTPFLTNRPVVSISTNNVVTNSVIPQLSSYNGIWASDTNGSFNLMIRSGQPSGISDFTISGFYNPVINNNGAIAFIGYSTATSSVTINIGTVTNALTNVSSIYLSLPGATNKLNVASVGSPAPGLPDNFSSFGTMVLPDVGGVIFTGWAGTNNGIWVQNSDFSVHLVAFRGQSIPSGSSNKVISSFTLINHFHNQDTGIITYQAYFTDGTSAIVRVNR
jgi:hypothetical protein